MLPITKVCSRSADTLQDDTLSTEGQKAKGINPLLIRAYVLLEARVRSRHEAQAEGLLHVAVVWQSVQNTRDAL